MSSNLTTAGALAAALAVLALGGGCGSDETTRTAFPPSTGIPGGGAAGFTPAPTGTAGTGTAGRAPTPPSGTAGIAAPSGVAGRAAGAAGMAPTMTPPASGAAGTSGAATGGTGSTATAGTSGAATGGTGSTATAGTGAATAGTGGMMAAGTGGSAAGTGGKATGGSSAPMVSGGKCCPDGNCLCHGEPPAQLTAGKGPYRTASKRLSSGTMHYPTDAEPPFAGVAICPGFLNSGPEMAAWGPFYASWGIVTVVTNTLPTDIPAIRAGLLLGAVDDMKKENTASGSPVNGKMSGRYGTSGYSMGGGGTTIAAQRTPALGSSIGLAAWGGAGERTTVPTLLLCGDSDSVAPCIMSEGVYGGIPDSTPKMIVAIPAATHFAWFGPTDTLSQLSGKYALAFQKVFLEGDTRWKSLLTGKGGGSVRTNIK